jgi:ABC-type antimicrobial peptide transport system permease subunit
MTWSLHKRIGETLTYTDEAGRELRLRFVASLEDSIFQGSVLISEEAFVRHFPSTSGNRVLLVDAPKEKEARVSQGLLRSFRDFGIELVTASARLADFTKVRNTYLSIFLFLGGLGLVIGSAGSGIVVMRNVLERREELAVLRAVGFTKKAVRGVVYREHAFMIAAGVVCGAVSALMSVIPMLMDRGTGPSSAFLVAVLAAVVAINFGWTYVATALAMRGEPLSALRRE